MKQTLLPILLVAVIFGAWIYNLAITPGTPLNLLLYTPTPGK